MKTLAFLTVTLILSTTTTVTLAHAEKKKAGTSPSAESPAAPPTDPNVKKTADAFDGVWTCNDTVLMPGAPAPAKVKETLSCKKIALGQGVVCDDHTTGVPEIGVIEGTFLIGHDSGAKATHLFAVNSLEEVHDHRCVWKDDKTLVCDPLKGSFGGQPTIEEITLAWPQTNVHTWTVVLTMKNGAKANIDATCTRSNKKTK